MATATRSSTAKRSTKVPSKTAKSGKKAATPARRAVSAKTSKNSAAASSRKAGVKAVASHSSLRDSGGSQVSTVTHVRTAAPSAAKKPAPTKPSINPRYKDIEKYLGVVSGPTDLSTKKLSAK